ncbi:MAG: hypothetical protein Q8K58_10420 [Acidimicrobiales bacterium]|nr:hypothetical protein [Acidimicrobiales bacterium]
MSPLWAIAPGVVAVGGLLALIGLRRIDLAAREVAVELQRLRDVRTALDHLSAAADDTLVTAERVRTRPPPWAR